MIDSADERHRGSSLVGLLMVIVILGSLATIAVTSVSGENLDGLTGGPAPGNAEANTTITSTPAPSLLSVAAMAACRADVVATSTAVAVDYARTGIYPSTIAQLVSGGWLPEAPNVPGETFSLQAVRGIPTGRVLVNGNMGAGACND